jgi:hypothetical protein
MTAPPEIFARTSRRSARLDSPAAPSSLSLGSSTRVVRRIDQLRALEWELDALADRAEAPATSRPAWLFPALEPTKTAHPWAVLLRDSNDVLRGAVFLVDSTDADTVDVPGGPVVVRNVNEVHRAALVADDAESARLLGQSLAAELRALPGPVRLALGPLPAASDVTKAFAHGIPAAVLVDGVGIPEIARDAAGGVDEYLTSSLRRTLRKARNRIAADGCRFVTQFERRPREIADLLPAVEFAHRERDHARGLPSELDHASTTLRWRRRMLGLAEAGRLEVGLAYLDGELAAHVVGIVDGPTYRVLEGHLVTSWSRYAPGRLLEAEVVQRVLDDPLLAGLDWMTSVAPEALLATNGSERVVTVRADFT